MATQLRIDTTPERANHNSFQSVGMARKVVPVIDTLWRAWGEDERNGVPKADRRGISSEQWEALRYYRDQAHKAEDDQCQSSPLAPERIMGGSRSTMTSGPIPKNHWSPAIAETNRIENALGGLRELVRAIAVDDTSLTAYCILKHGGREKGGRIVPRGEKEGQRRIKEMLFDLRYAAGMIVR